MFKKYNIIDLSLKKTIYTGTYRECIDKQDELLIHGNPFTKIVEVSGEAIT